MTHEMDKQFSTCSECGEEIEHAMLADKNSNWFCVECYAETQAGSPMTQKHSELPWAWDKFDNEIYVEKTNLHVAEVVVYLQEYEANAEFLVFACNSHAKLVEALEEIRDYGGMFTGEDARNMQTLANSTLQQLKETDNE